MATIQAIEITSDLVDDRTICDFVVRNKRGGFTKLSPDVVEILNKAIAYQLEPIAIICKQMGKQSGDENDAAGRLDFRMLEPDRVNLARVLDVFSAIGLTATDSAVVDLAKQISLQRGECPECKQKLEYDKGERQTYHEPELPPAFFCRNCGVEFSVDAVSRETLTLGEVEEQ